MHRRNYFRELAGLRQELSLHLLIRKLLNRFGATDYDRLLELLNPKTIELLGRYDRDRAASLVCRILFAQPRFLRFAPLLGRAALGRVLPKENEVNSEIEEAARLQ